MLDCLQRRKLEFPDCDALGIVTPTYAWGLPDIVAVFLRHVRIRSRYTFFIATYGTTPGNTAYFAQKYLGRKLDAKFSLKMPDIFTP